ncbi:hypothetical protein COU61_00415, partial [Candidatus Pacearchaeota archaeon CG10_big_fil_rev_8_21_14_0_10_35_13]
MTRLYHELDNVSALSLLPDTSIYHVMASRNWGNLSPIGKQIFIDGFHDFLRVYPGVSGAEVRGTPFMKVLSKIYHYNINDARRKAGLDERYVRNRDIIPPRVWAERKGQFLSFLRDSSGLVTKEDIGLYIPHLTTFKKFFSLKIIDALVEAGFDGSGINFFLRGYYSGVSSRFAKEFSRHRKALGLPTLPLDDLVQEGMVGINNSFISALNKGIRPSYALASRAMVFGVQSSRNTDSGHYSTITACRFPPDNLQLSLDKILGGLKEPSSVPEINALSSLNPAPLEYQMLDDNVPLGSPPNTQVAVDELNDASLKDLSMPERPFVNVGTRELVSALSKILTPQELRVVRDY